MKLILLLCLVAYITANPLILYKWKNQCTFPVSLSDNKTRIPFTDQVITLTRRSVTLHLNLCGNIPPGEYPGCSGGKSICLLEDNREIDVGTHFIVDPDNEFYLKSVGGPTECKDDVTLLGLTLNKNMRLPKLQPGEKECSYEIFYPDPTMSPKCAFRIGNGELIDLHHLNSPIFVQSEQRRFFFTLCGSDSRCDAGVSACEALPDGKNKSLVSVDTQLVTYSDNKKELSVRGTFGVSKKSKIRFYANLKCNWTVSDIHNATLNQIQSSNKKYIFEMQSRDACVKLPLNCVVLENTFKYNLSKFYNNVGYTKVSNTSSEMFINVCGPLKLPSNENLCSNHSSQVCEIKNREYINHGSIFNDFNVINNKIELIIQDGSTCKENPNVFYSTKIIFECHTVNEGPNFQRDSNCVTEILWKSPFACPFQEINDCPPMANEKFKCVYNFTEKSFDLSKLKRTNGSFYTVLDKDNENIEYLLNVCAGLNVPEAPCLHNTMAVVRKVNERHLANRFIPLGSRVMGNLVHEQLELTLFGGFKSDFFVQCESMIRFNCSNEEKIILTEKNGCNYKFVWNSAAGCSNLRDTCKFEYNDKVVQFNSIRSKVISFPSIDRQTNYSVSICREKYQLCTKDKCTNFPIKDRNFTVTEGVPKLELKLTDNSNCDQNTTYYNKVVYQFLCPTKDFTDNDYLKDYVVEKCNIFINMSTDVACPLRVTTTTSPLKKEFEFKVHDKILPEKEEAQFTNKTVKTETNQNEVFAKTTSSPITVGNCSLFNQNTGFTYSLNELRPFKVPFSDSCPISVYNLTHHTVKLFFSTKTPCSKEINYSYEILLNCTKLAVPLRSLKMSKCRESLQIDDPDVCHLFKQAFSDVNPASTGLIVGLSTSLILLTLSIVLCGFLFRKKIYSCCLKRRQSCSDCSSFSYSYVKDADR